jgi:hypothetical protein
MIMSLFAMMVSHALLRIEAEMTEARPVSGHTSNIRPLV